MFYYFFGILYYGLGRNSSKRFFYFLFSLFLGHSQLILAWLEAIMVFFKFLNFFAIFLEFSITGLVGTHQNDFFFFFLGLSQLILAWKVAKVVVFNFLNCFAIFWNFLLWVRKELIGTIFFFVFYFLSFSAYPNIFWREKKPQCCFLIFWIFLRFFFNVLLRVG